MVDFVVICRNPSSESLHIEQLLVDHEFDQPVSVEGDDTTEPSTEQVQQLIAQIQGNVEVVVFSPLVDEFGEITAQQLNAHGYAVTVISPDVTTDETVSEEFVRIERTNRVQMLRNRNIPVADWSPEKPLVWPVGNHRGVR